MSPGHNRVPFVAAYQLMASYLVWDLRDLLAEGKLTDSSARERLNEFIVLLNSGLRAAQPSYPAQPAGTASKGRARAEGATRLASLNEDEELLHLIRVAHGDDRESQWRTWAEKASEILAKVKDEDWVKPREKPEQQFIEEELEAFLRRLQRIDQLEVYRLPKRPGLTRR